MDIFKDFEKRIITALNNANLRDKNGEAVDFSRVIVETPRDADHGDLATNAALVLAQTVGRPPRQLAEQIKNALQQDKDIESIEIAGPGFINFRLRNSYWYQILETICQDKINYGRSTRGQGIKVNVEYVSANPTGPLHVGHCRGAVVGDVIANLLAFTGYDITKEYYINDAGSQIDILARSVFLRYREALGQEIGDIPEGLYPGDYLIELGQHLAKKYGDQFLTKEEAALPLFKQEATNAMIRKIREDLSLLNIHHDVFFSEKTLHDDGQKAIRQAIDKLKQSGHVYKGTLAAPKGTSLAEDWEPREQLLFRSTAYGDDQDRALAKSDGSFTYFAADIAYFYDKYKRHFKEMIYVLGADHSGYVKRLEAMAAAISDGEACLTAILCQLVKLYRNHVPVKMSKRAGNFVTLAEVVKEVGADPIRFMMLFRKADAMLDFDLSKVREQSKDNPVFYVQYAHARGQSILRQAESYFGEEVLTSPLLKKDFSLLNSPSELSIIKKLAQYPRLIETAACQREPHRLAFYLYDLAALFHAQWHKGNEDKTMRFIIPEEKNLSLARIALIEALLSVLQSGLMLIGVTAPNQMS